MIIITMISIIIIIMMMIVIMSTGSTAPTAMPSRSTCVRSQSCCRAAVASGHGPPSAPRAEMRWATLRTACGALFVFTCFVFYVFVA